MSEIWTFDGIENKHDVYRGEYSVKKLKYSIPKEIYVVFRNRSNYDNHFVIKELIKEFEKCKTFSVAITKNAYAFRLIKMEKKLQKLYRYRLQFLDSTRFMVGSLSNLVEHLAERVHEIKSKHGHANKNCKT